ncbi:MAG: sigma 54-interacting transcriptional regulator [Polyangiaceae bacterium]|nr:sigma 54-interacting transcriptional regulator [Polyangiaceae bacterium]
MANRPTTEEHRPPSAAETPAGIPALLGVFPQAAFLPFPQKPEVWGRDVLAARGISDSKMSGEHARFWIERGKFYVQDLGSRNGTFIDGQKLQPNDKVELVDGHTVRLAVTIFVFRSAFSGSQTPQPPLGALVGPWGLSTLRTELNRLRPNPNPNILLHGPTGTGKELLAQEVVQRLGRDPQKCTRVNVTSVPEAMFDGQFFGWERGAFSGADKTNRGVFLEHDKGAVFLDEIGELPLQIQPKLLRLLENREVLAIGATRPKAVDLAIIGATNRPLNSTDQGGSLRTDILARFSVRYTLPALEDRPEDLFAILQEMWRRRYGALDLTRTRVDAEAVERLMLHDWPANVRDVDRLLSTVDPSHGLTLSAANKFVGGAAHNSTPILTKEAVLKALKDCGNNQSEAARALGIDRGKLLRYMQKHEIK